MPISKDSANFSLTAFPFHLSSGMLVGSNVTSIYFHACGGAMLQFDVSCDGQTTRDPREILLYNMLYGGVMSSLFELHGACGVYTHAISMPECAIYRLDAACYQYSFPEVVTCTSFDITGTVVDQSTLTKGACLSCPAGKGINSLLSTDHDSADDCHSCLPGTYLFNGKCEVCPVGSYKSTIGPSPCLSCPVGKSTTGPSARDHDSVSDCQTRTCPKGTAFTVPYKQSFRILPIHESTPYIGTPEVLHNFIWGTVDNDYWDMDDAQVLCHSLGMGDAVSISEGSYGPSFSTQWSGFNCRGDELSLQDCQQAWDWGGDEWGVMDEGSLRRPNYDDAGVVCSHSSTLKIDRFCQVCPSGYYSDLPGADQCKKCPAGTITVGDKSPNVAYAVFALPENHDEILDCKHCVAGSFTTNGATCNVCPAGSYSYASPA